jgi:hypothetical protein
MSARLRGTHERRRLVHEHGILAGAVAHDAVEASRQEMTIAQLPDFEAQRARSDCHDERPYARSGVQVATRAIEDAQQNRGRIITYRTTKGRPDR